jgi:hypothetical protein
MTVTSQPAWRKYQAVLTPITPAPRTITRIIKLDYLKKKRQLGNMMHFFELHFHIFSGVYWINLLVYFFI